MSGSDSRKFDWQVCGHENIVRFLQSALLAGRVSHAYLFYGQTNLGKSKVAGELINTLLCQDEQLAPCRRCVGCRQFQNLIHPDFYSVGRTRDEKTGKLHKDILIDQIRHLRSQLQQATFLNGYKVALISDAHLMNANTANALLKVLEEPTPRTVIILLADDLAALPLTIVSRCQTIKFLPVATAKITAWLAGRGESAAAAIAHRAYGRPGLALALATDPAARQAVDDNIASFLAILAADYNNRFKLVGEAIDWDKDEIANDAKLEKLLDDWRSAIRDLLLLKSGNESLVANRRQLAKLRERAQTANFPRLWSLAEQINRAGAYRRQNITVKTILENLIINI